MQIEVCVFSETGKVSPSKGDLKVICHFIVFALTEKYFLDHRTEATHCDWMFFSCVKRVVRTAVTGLSTPGYLLTITFIFARCRCRLPLVRAAKQEQAEKIKGAFAKSELLKWKLKNRIAVTPNQFMYKTGMGNVVSACTTRTNFDIQWLFTDIGLNKLFTLPMP